MSHLNFEFIYFFFFFAQENYIHIPNFINEDAQEVMSQDETYGTVGLYNLGNTCFLNTSNFLKKKKNICEKTFSERYKGY
jgi:hypothetical protein